MASSFRAFAVEVIGDLDELNLTGFSVLSVKTLMAVGTSSILDLRERLLRVRTDATLMSRETHSETKLFSPNVFLNLSSSKDSSRFFESIGFVISFSTLALLSDEVVPDGDSWVFRSTIPTETLELRTKLRSSGSVTYIKESDNTEAAIISTKITASFRKITEEFAENIGLPALSALRKKAIHDLLREHGYGKLTDVLMNPDPLLKYYSHLKQELLSSRLDELAKIFDKMWDTASQVGRDLAEMLETMHEKIEAASMLIFGTLAFQAYLFASQAINASQLFSLLFIFSSGLVFFVLFTQFRISGTSQNAHMAMRTLDSVEQQVIAQTGLETSPQWKDGPMASFKDLERRVDTIETLTWAFLTLNASAISYFAYAMSKTGIDWRIALAANLGLLVTFLLCLAYTRRDVMGFRIFTGRTKPATVLLSLSVIILIANSVLSIGRYWPELSSFLRF